jgi:hypothetical protein
VSRERDSERATLLVCEDGHEYTTRFERFFGAAFRFVRAGNFAEALRAAPTAAGLLFDLDFRRTAPAELVDENGTTEAARAKGETARLAGLQGILILRALRTTGITAPALLFADLEDEARTRFLETSLAPLHVVPSREGLAQIGSRLSALTKR